MTKPSGAIAIAFSCVGHFYAHYFMAFYFIVVLDLESGTYYGLDEVGLRMWTLLHSHGDVGFVYQAILEEYEVPPKRLRQDLLDFVDLLASQSLLELRDE